MEYLWNIHGISMEYLWNIYGIPMEYLWNIYVMIYIASRFWFQIIDMCKLTKWDALSSTGADGDFAMSIYIFPSYKGDFWFHLAFMFSGPWRLNPCNCWWIPPSIIDLPIFSYFFTQFLWAAQKYPACQRKSLMFSRNKWNHHRICSVECW